MKLSPERREAAAAWLAAQRRSVMSIEERAAFEAWKQDPENLKALNAMQALWDEMAGLKGDRQPAPVADAPRRAQGRSARLAAAVATAAVVLGTISYYASAPLAFASSASTGVGEQRSRTLPDGSVVSLNVATRLEYRMHARSRDVRLREGQALFTVEKDRARPFLVLVGDYQVRAVGTVFDVRLRNGEAQVSVQEGQVAITRIKGPGTGQVVADLTAGQKLDLSGAASSQPASVVVRPVAAQEVGEWRLRTLAYQDAPVSEVVSDLNRFFPDPVVIRDPALANRRVTLRLQVSDRATTLTTLDALLGVKVEGGTKPSGS